MIYARENRGDCAAFLSRTDLFAEAGEATRLAFAEAFERVLLPGGTTLECHGIEGASLYIIRRGRVRVELDGQTGSVTLELGQGQFFGELALLRSGASRATAFAVRDSEILVLPRETFRALAMEHPEALWSISQIVVGRLGMVMRGAYREAPVVSIACIPVVDAPVNEEIVAALCRSLEAGGSTLRIGPEVVRARTGCGDVSSIPWGDARNESLASWLNDLELEYRFLLYEGHSRPDEWTARCLRQADRILLIAPASLEADFDEIRHRYVLNDRCCLSEVRVEALLYHPPDTEVPSGGVRWREHPEVRRVHHVRLGNEADFARATRCLTNTAVGLVLGGGGARGIAHVGALRALEEADVPVDLIGGTSAGSIFAAGYALGWSAEEMLERVRRVFQRRRALVDLTFPFIALLSGGKLSRVLRELFDGRRIEDLWLDYYCVSVSLTGARLLVHERGDLWRHVRSSCALPGIFPPVHTGDEILVDGGVMNNLPTDVMARRTLGGTTISIDVSGDDSAAGAPFDTRVSGWRSLGFRLLSKRTSEDRMLNIFDVLLRSTVVASRAKRNLELGLNGDAYYLRPPVSRFGVMDFGAFDELYRIGYDYTRQQLERWGLQGSGRALAPRHRAEVAPRADVHSSRLFDRVAAPGRPVSA